MNDLIVYFSFLVWNYSKAKKIPPQINTLIKCVGNAALDYRSRPQSSEETTSTNWTASDFFI